MRLRYGVTVGHTLPAGQVYLPRPCGRPVVWIRFYYCELLPQFAEFADLTTVMTAETRSIRSVSRITTVTRPRRYSRSSTRNKMWPSMTTTSTSRLICHRSCSYAPPTSLDTISPPLLDRCEVIQLSGYTHDEKLHIARRFLLPKQLAQNGLSEPHVQLTEPCAAQNGHALHARGWSAFTGAFDWRNRAIQGG
ncbi:hypothetical protein H4582DRAFT_653922 [Lactarius indigo]|nr:hypothetical protein H4582DRAFT_653922 [Lactarius indigo]